MRYSIKTFFPLLIAFCAILLLTATRQLYAGWNLMNAMTDFLAAYFILFGTCKLITVLGFAKRYKTYDLLSQYNALYAYGYPLIELALGIAYFYRVFPIITSAIAFILMLTNSISVALALSTGHEQICACFGTIFKLPLTYITLLQHILITGMALGVLLSLVL